MPVTTNRCSYVRCVWWQLTYYTKYEMTLSTPPEFVTLLCHTSSTLTYVRCI